MKSSTRKKTSFWKNLIPFFILAGLVVVLPITLLFVRQQVNASPQASGPADTDSQPILPITFSATASRTYDPDGRGTYSLAKLSDNVPSTFWLSGNFSPQWIELDLRSPTDVAYLELLVTQEPAGATTHKIYAGSTPNPQTQVHQFDVVTKSGSKLGVVFSPTLKNIRYIRIVTTTSPSWVGWSEVKVYSSNPNNGRVKTNGKGLINVATGQEFTVRSNQYAKFIQRDGHWLISTFGSQYSSAEVAQTFKDMSKYGYNTVRLVYNTATDTEYETLSGACKERQTYNITSCVSQRSLDNLANALSLARQNNLKVILSFVGGTPFRYYTSGSSPYNSANINYLKEETIRDSGRFYKDTLNYLKSKVSLSTIVAIQPTAEPELLTSTYPFSIFGIVLSYPQFYVPAGRQFTTSATLQNKVNGQMSPGMKELNTFALVNAFNHWFGRIKEADENLLTLYDQYPVYAVRSDAYRNVDDMVIVHPSLQANILGMQLYPDYLPGA